MTKFSISGSNVFLKNDLDCKLLDTLPTGTYALNFHPDLGYYLSVMPDFTMPKKLYGNAEKMSDRFLNTFEVRPATTGVLLSGNKGSGKSLTMKLTALKAMKKSIPVIVISNPFYGQAFNTFIQSIEQPCVLVFDEFEKVYDEIEIQNSLLTLLDGTFSSKKLIIFTCNDENRINEHMINRPGRIYYNLQYEGLSEEFIREYCNDILEDKHKIENIVRLTSLVAKFNFDMLQALVEELNRYKETVKEAVEILNIKYVTNHYNTYEATLTKDDKEIDVDNEQVHNPLSRELISIGYVLNAGKKNETYDTVEFDTTAPTKFISNDFNTIRLEQDGYKLNLVRKERHTFDFRSYL